MSNSIIMRNITFDENLDKEKIKAKTKAILKEIGEALLCGQSGFGNFKKFKHQMA